MKTPFLFPVLLAATQFVLSSIPVAETDAAAVREKLFARLKEANTGLQK